MAIGQLASTGKENNKFYRITMFNGSPSLNRGVHFYASQKIENITDLKTYVDKFGYTYQGSTWKFIDASGYYSSSALSKIFLTTSNDIMGISIDNTQSNLASATFICSEV